MIVKFLNPKSAFRNPKSKWAKALGIRGLIPIHALKDMTIDVNINEIH